jgi:hypothetical protein
MSPIIIRDLPPNVEAFLLERARGEGRPVDEVAASLLVEAAASADDESEMWL